jgi:hypothetical protein
MLLSNIILQIVLLLTSISMHNASAHPLRSWTDPSCRIIDHEIYTSIANTLALFSVAYDTRSLTLLSSVFTPTAVTNFSSTAPLQSGIPAITSFLNSTITPGGSQHISSTIHIVRTGEGTADVTSYVSATFFGSGNLTGQIFQSWGIYFDEFVRGIDGWLIQSRKIEVLVCL